MIYRLAPDNMYMFAGQECREEYLGFVKVAFCTRAYLNKMIRLAYKCREEKRMVTPHHQPNPPKGGIIYEGCYFSSWTHAGESWDADAKVGFERSDLGFLTLPLNEIVEIQTH